MKKLATYAVLASAGLALAACGSADDASTEAMPDTVEMPADEALEPIAEEPVEDEAVAGPPADAAARAPDPVITEQAADDAAAVAAEAEAAMQALEGIDDIPVEE